MSSIPYGKCVGYPLRYTNSEAKDFFKGKTRVLDF